MPRVITGFHNMRDLKARVVENAQAVDQAVRQATEIYEQVRREMFDQFVQFTTDKQQVIRLTGTASMQPLGEDGNPLPVKVAQKFYAGFPIVDVGIAWGDNRKSRAKMTIQDANDNTDMVQRSDSNWHQRLIIHRLFYDNSFSWTDPDHDESEQPYTIYPFANGDSREYLFADGSTATDNHFLAQAAAISDAANPFPTIVTEIREHPGNENGEIVVLVAENLETDIRALADFVPFVDPDIQTTQDRVVATPPAAVPVGEKWLGKVGECWIKVWKKIPASYMFGLLVDGQEKVLAYREETEPELQGLRIENHSPDGNHNDYRFLRTGGYGVRNPLGGVAYRIGNAAYAPPTGYDVDVLTN